jgi:hypothetical protein
MRYTAFTVAAGVSTLLGRGSAFCTASSATCTPSATYNSLEEKLKEIENLSGIKGPNNELHINNQRFYDINTISFAHNGPVIYNSSSGLLGWDEMVMLAPASAPARNDQKSALSGVIYEKQTSPQLKSLIDQLLAGDLSSLPTDFERANVR